MKENGKRIWNQFIEEKKKKLILFMTVWICLLVIAALIGVSDIRIMIVFIVFGITLGYLNTRAWIQYKKTIRSIGNLDNLYEQLEKTGNIPGVLIATNDLEIAELVKNSDAELIVCGGTVQKSTGSMYGYYATQMMESFKFDVGFFGTASIDEKFRVLTPTIEKAFLKKLLLKNCNQSFLVADNSKFNRIAMYKVADLVDYVGVITDHQFNEKEVTKLTKSGIKIITV